MSNIVSVLANSGYVYLWIIDISLQKIRDTYLTTIYINDYSINML